MKLLVLGYFAVLLMLVAIEVVLKTALPGACFDNCAADESPATLSVLVAGYAVIVMWLIVGVVGFLGLVAFWRR